MKEIKRKIGKGCHYYFTDSKNRKWSVLDSGSLMKGHCEDLIENPFDFWEAILMKGERLDSDTMLRAKTKEKLNLLIEDYE